VETVGGSGRPPGSSTTTMMVDAWRVVGDQMTHAPAEAPQPAVETPPAVPAASRRQLVRRWTIVSGGVLAAGAIVVLAAAGRFDGLALLTPASGITVEVLAGLALVGSWLSRRRRWYLIGVPAIVSTAAAVTAVVAVVLWLTGTVTDAYPVTFGVWVGMGLAALIGLPFVLTRSAVVCRWLAVVAGAPALCRA